jgi:hypothetical protein
VREGVGFHKWRTHLGWCVLRVIRLVPVARTCRSAASDFAVAISDDLAAVGIFSDRGMMPAIRRVSTAFFSRDPEAMGSDRDIVFYQNLLILTRNIVVFRLTVIPDLSLAISGGISPDFSKGITAYFLAHLSPMVGERR